MVRDITEVIVSETDIIYACTGNLSHGGYQDSLVVALPGINKFNSPFNFTGTTKLRK